MGVLPYLMSRPIVREVGFANVVECFAVAVAGHVGEPR